MKWISYCTTMSLVGLQFLFSSAPLYADVPNSFRQQHPLAWQHNLPAGEMPGWSNPWWINFEVSNGNVWNAPLIMNDRRNSRQYEYNADFEQAHAILELGHAFTESLGVAVEIPYAYRSGGLLDNTIDAFHLLIGNRRFNRQFYPKYQNKYSVKTDGVEYYTEDHLADGVSNIGFKMKYWFIKWLGIEDGSCACGVSILSQTKFPVKAAELGGTTGDIDQSFVLNFGIPLFYASSLGLSAGYTFLGDNPAMKDWPRNDHIIMYEMNLDFAVGMSWGLTLSARAESPFLQGENLDYYDTSTDPAIISRNRVASGWASLVYWRGTESMGIHYRTRNGDQIQLQMVEDWGIGSHDTNDHLYTNDAPDVNFVLQTKWTW